MTWWHWLGIVLLLTAFAGVLYGFVLAELRSGLEERRRLLEALDNLVGWNAPHERSCEIDVEHDEDDDPCIYCEAREVLATARRQP